MNLETENAVGAVGQQVASNTQSRYADILAKRRSGRSAKRKHDDVDNDDEPSNQLSKRAREGNTAPLEIDDVPLQQTTAVAEEQSARLNAPESGHHDKDDDDEPSNPPSTRTGEEDDTLAERSNVQPKETAATNLKQPARGNAPKRKRAEEQRVEEQRALPNTKRRRAGKPVPLGESSDYQEPKGVRKSNRIAGKPAEVLTLPPPKSRRRRGDVPADPTPDPLQAAAESNTPVPTIQSSQEAHGSVQEQNDESIASPQVSEHDSNQEREFLRGQASNVSDFKMVRLLTHAYDSQDKLDESLRFGKGGIVDLAYQIRQVERCPEAPDKETLKALRDLHAKKTDHLQRVREVVQALVEPMRDLNATHASFNENIYGFVDLRREDPVLSCFPEKYWRAYDRCLQANATCKAIENKVHVAEQERNKIMEEARLSMINAVCPHDSDTAGDSAVNPRAPLRHSTETARKRVQNAGIAAVNLSKLKHSLDAAKDARYKEEYGLNKIAEDAFIAAGLLEVETDVEEVEFRRRLPGKYLDNDQSTERSPAPQSIAQDSLKAGLAREVKHARDKLRRARHDLSEARSGPLPGASSMDSDAQGAARVLNMNRCTGVVRDVEAQHRSIMHRAQYEHAISMTYQRSNFQDHSSDGYNKVLLELYGYPMSKKKEDRIDKWRDDTSEKVKRLLGEEVTADAREQLFDNQANQRPANGLTRSPKWAHRRDEQTAGKCPQHGGR